MVWQAHPDLTPLLIGACLTAAIAGYLLWRERTGKRMPGQLLAAAIASLLVVSLTAFALEQASVERGAKIFWNQVLYVGDAVLPALLLAYVVVYTGHDMSRRRYAALFVVPVFILLSVFTNGVHGLFWSGLTVDTVNGYWILGNEAGPLFYGYVAFAYACLFVALGLLVRTAFDSSEIHHWNLNALVVGTLAPGLGGVFYLLSVGPEPTPNYVGYAYLVTAASFAYSVHRRDLFTLVPIARRTAIEQLDVGVLTIGLDGRIASANDAAVTLLDRGDVTVRRRPVTDVLGDLADAVDLDSETRRKVTVETDSHVLEVAVYPLLRDEVVVGRQIVLHDVTDRVRQKRELEELTARLRLALEGTNTGVWEWTLDGEVLWDEQSERLYGYDPGGFPGTYEAFADRVHPDDLPAVENQLEEALATGEPYQTAFRIRHADGGERWIQTRGIAEYDDGEPVRMLGVQTDVTDRKRFERDLEAQNRKLELLNGIIRHDIRNEASFILNLHRRTDRDGGGSPPEAQGHEREGDALDRIEQRAERIVDLTDRARDLVAAISKSRGDLEPVALLPLLERVTVTTSTLRPDATVRLDGSPPDVSVRANDMLESLFRDLLVNGVKHNDSDEPEVVVSARVAGGDVVVEVADNGPGIPPAQRDAVFQEGRTLRGSDGTGFGLYLVRTLVDQYGGSVTISESESLGGAAVRVTLPIVADERASDGGGESASSAVGR
ncbi:histidine kinase N-terminal 7TM domain-containing protein [Halobellus sp. GM3]|uniref:histidine kinase N-terminal 7TM domain-containing protein n=1 Tax=Halobellus sp. GM3 TaxID=3458410 RepID=UPI00403D6E96